MVARLCSPGCPLFLVTFTFVFANDSYLPSMCHIHVCNAPVFSYFFLYSVVSWSVFLSYILSLLFLLFCVFVLIHFFPFTFPSLMPASLPRVPQPPSSLTPYCFTNVRGKRSWFAHTFLIAQQTFLPQVLQNFSRPVNCIPCEIFSEALTVFAASETLRLEMLLRFSFIYTFFFFFQREKLLLLSTLNMRALRYFIYV